MTAMPPPGTTAVGDTDVAVPRLIAAFIDGLIFVAVYLVISLPFGFNGGFNPIVFLPYGLWLAYYVYMETQQGGQTIGKKAMGVKVVKMDGSELTPTDSVVRNVLRIVDNLPCIPLVGIIMIFVNPLHQRLGDIAAKTLVVKA
jgi:uncharacterized RDD family membrane protein YckC